MLATSDEVIAAWLSPARQLSIRVKVGTTTYGSEDVTSLSFDSGSISGEVYQIGSTYMNTVQIVFPSIIETIKEDQEVIPELGILVDGEYHYSKLGHFFITEFNRDRNAKTTTITASDKMIYMEGVYESKLTYSKPYREVALEIANLAGVEVNQDSFASLGTGAIKKPVGYTFRQAIGLIAQFEGGFASFNRDGELEIRRLRPTEFEVTPESYLLKGFSKNENAYRIGGITVRIGEEETDVLRVGSTNGSQVELENKVMTQILLNNMWELVKNLNYFPFELKWRGCPLLEAGDWMYVTDRDGNRYSVPNLSYSLTFNGGLSGESKATTNSSSQATYKYRGPLNQRVDRIDSILSANNWNTNYYDATEPPNPKKGDTWFKPNGQDTEIWVYEEDAEGNLSWVLQISSAPNQELLDEIQSAVDAANDAVAIANAGSTIAEYAQEIANAANDLAAQAKEDLLDLTGVVDGTLKKVSDLENGYSVLVTQVQGQETRLANVELTADGLTTTVASVQEEMGVVNTQIAEIQVTAESIKSTVADLASTTQSQITQLSDAINLRVEKGDVINQINISEEGILIDGDNIWITGQTKIDNGVIGTAQIQDASISNAKIISVNANKIVANTLSAITTNTGALNVSGWLTMSTENKGILGSYDFGDEYGKAYNYRWFVGEYRFSHRHLYFSAKSYNVTTSDTKGTYRYDTETFYGPDYVKMRQYKSTGALICRSDINADKIAIGGSDWANSAYMDSSGFGYFGNGAQVNGGNGLTVGLPGLNVGRINAPDSYDTLIINNSRTDLPNLQIGGSNFYINNLRSALADFRVGKDGSSINGGRVVQSSAVYKRTYSGTANMIVLDTGTIGRTTSARKYKADIQPAYDVIAKAKKVLELNPSSWWDKGELADGVAKERYYGFIADEFAEAGLNEVVVYRDGEIESLAYDRIPMYHNVILSEHEKEIQELKAKVQQLENEIRVLQAA